MLRKTLLASLAIVSLNQIQATTEPQDHTNKCPPCPCASGASGWVLIPTGDMKGTLCNQSPLAKEEEKKEVVPPHHHSHHSHEKKSLHPPRTPEEEGLEAQLKNVKPNIYQTQHGGEWGKALGDKVYFKKLGNWVHDPSVKPEDIIKTGVKDKIKQFNELGRNQQPPKAKTPEPKSTVEPTPTPTKGYTGKRYKVNTPDALGTTARPNTVYTNPSQGNQRQFSQGAPNQAQKGETEQSAQSNPNKTETGVTEEKAVENNISPVAPPPPPPPPPPAP